MLPVVVMVRPKERVDSNDVVNEPLEEAFPPTGVDEKFKELVPRLSTVDEGCHEGVGPPLFVPPPPPPPPKPEGVERDEVEGVIVREPSPLPPPFVGVGGEEGVVEGAEGLGDEESDSVGLFELEPLALPGTLLGEREGEGEALPDPPLINAVGEAMEVALLPLPPWGDPEVEALPVRDGPPASPVGDARLEGVLCPPPIQPPREGEGVDESQNRGVGVGMAEGDEKGDAVSTSPVYSPIPMVGVVMGVGVSKVTTPSPPGEAEEVGVEPPSMDGLEAVVGVSVGCAPLPLALPLLEGRPEAL
jgi:hypothetical protein